jgi:hypothetical protein
MEVARRFRDDPSLLLRRRPNLYLVRVRTGRGARARWTDQWLEPVPTVREELEVEPIDEVRVQRIRKARLPRRGSWQADYFHVPAAVAAEPDRPFYPLMLLVVDPRRQAPLGLSTSSPADFVPAFQNLFLGAIESARAVPLRVQVQRADARRILEPITTRLQIDVEQAELLESIDFVRAGLATIFIGDDGED